MTTNHFLCLMAACFLFGTTFFFKDKASDLEKENKQLKDSLKTFNHLAYTQERGKNFT